MAAGVNLLRTHHRAGGIEGAEDPRVARDVYNARDGKQ